MNLAPGKTGFSIACLVKAVQQHFIFFLISMLNTVWLIDLFQLTSRLLLYYQVKQYTHRHRYIDVKKQ